MKLLTFIKQNLPTLFLLLNSCVALFYQSMFLKDRLCDLKEEPWRCSDGSCPIIQTVFEIAFFITDIYAIIIGLYFITRRPSLSQLLFLLPVTFILCISPFTI